MFCISGQYPQNLNSAAVTWSLAKQLYGPHGPYIWIPLALVFGAVPTAIQWAIAKVSEAASDPSPTRWLMPLTSQRWPVIRGVRIDSVILPIIYQYSSWMTSGTNSPILSIILVGIVSQLWLRRYHPRWFKKYNYILGGALDGGAQV